MEGLPISEPLRPFVGTQHKYADRGLVNHIVESEFAIVEQMYEQWLRFQGGSNSPRCFGVRFEAFTRDPRSVVVGLAKFFEVELDVTRIEAVLESISMDAMRKNFDSGGRGFIRRGQVGDGKRMLEPKNFERIQKLMETVARR